MKTINKKQSGIALILTIVISSVVLLIAGLIASIVMTQLKLASDISDSTIAIYAADSGVEYKLYQIRKEANTAGTEFSLSNGATTLVTVSGTLPNLTIKSLGSYLSVKRQFEVNF
ncbi:MAG: hypothetical protein ABIG73_00325 [Patescibacteria group bacterium]